MGREFRGIGAALTLAVLLALGGTMLSPGSAQALPQYSYGCDFCHRMPPVDSGTAKKNPMTGGVPGNHQGHSTAEVSSCLPCHGDVSAYAADHRNKIIELNDSLNYTRKQPGVFLNQTSVPPNPLGTCSNISCHGDGRIGFQPAIPVWGSDASTTNCSLCHDGAPNTGKHFLKHAAYYGTGDSGCAKCHSNHAGEAKPFSHATSVGKRGIDVRFTAAPNNGGGFAGGQCSNLYCHSDGRGNYKTVSWATGTTLTCAGCHGDASTGGADALSGQHAGHLNSAARLGGCVECHSNTVSDDSTISDISKHVDGHIDLAGRHLGGYDSGTGTCSTSYCHSDGKGTKQTITWTQPGTIGCNGCHGIGTPTGAPNYPSGTAGSLLANSHDKHVSSAGDCVNCHSKTTVTGTSLIAGGQHIDGFNNFTSGNGKIFGKAANKTCSNISCHSGNGVVQNVAPAQWGATLDCLGCHSTLTTAHTAHTGLYGCVDCHSTTVSSNTVVSNPANHLNNIPDVAGATYTGFTPGDHSCATSCHMAGAPKWDKPLTGQCGTCHNVTGPLITTKAHGAHFTALNGPQMPQTIASCQICHYYNGERLAPHGDGITNMNAGYPAEGACSDCHKQTTTKWGDAATVTCNSCHSSAGGLLSVISGVTAPDVRYAGDSGHGRAGIDKSCADCHDKNSAHINGTLGDKRLVAALGSGTNNTECSYCHSDAAKVSAKNLNIKTHMDTGLGSLCADCHNVHGTATNTMMVKDKINGTDVSFTGNDTFANEGRTGVCQVCHTSTQFYTKAGQPQTSHMDSTTNCLDCHSHNPTTGLAFTANGACNACHGYPPAPRKVISANTFGVMGNWSSAKFEDYSGGGGAHTINGHVPKDLKLTGTDADWTPCLPCHFDGAKAHARTVPASTHVENVTVTIDPQYRFSPDYFMIYSSAKFTSGGANKSGTCFNTSCHMGPSPKWSIER